MKWDNGEEDVVYITDLVFERRTTCLIYYGLISDCKGHPIFDWNDFEVVWDKSNRKNSVTTQVFSPVNLGERVKWRDDRQIEGTIARVRDVSLKNKENQTEADYNPAKLSRYYVDVRVILQIHRAAPRTSRQQRTRYKKDNRSWTQEDTY